MHRRGDTAREAAASAEICLVSLADDAAVTATYLADIWADRGLQSGAVVCELSTVAPATVGGPGTAGYAERCDFGSTPRCQEACRSSSPGLSP